MKKIITSVLIVLFVAAIILFCFFNFSTELEESVESKEEILPEEEISQEQDSETEIKLYFSDSTSNILVPEIRYINSKDLINNPYMYVLKLLLEGPKEEKYISDILDGTKINNINLKNGILYIDLNEQFLNSKGTNSIYSIVNTMTQFNEIEKIKITINGENKEGLLEMFSRKQ